MNQLSRIDTDSEIPKYKQVEDLIISDIEAGIFKYGQRIPSINETSEELILSRDTVEKAYVHLKKKGVLLAVRGKGYYVNKTDVGKKLKIALIFNKLSNYKRSLYSSFVSTVGNNASVDVHIYNYDIVEFENIINNHLNNYDYFVILPHFRNEQANISLFVKKIPKEKVLIIDKNLDELRDYPVVYQEYDKDIQHALGRALDLLKKYKKLNLVYPLNEYYSHYISRGFTIFNQIHDFDFSILNALEEKDIKKGEAYILISDNDLYDFIKIIKQNNWEAGKDIGLISYNDSPVKELLCDGISTISTNHDQIGQMAAEMILKKDFKRIKSPFEFIRRKSL